MSAPTCMTCKWWERTYADDDDDDDAFPDHPNDPGWGECKFITHWSRYDEDKPGTAEGRSPRAYTRDASNYASHLLCRETFGCIEHTPKPLVDEPPEASGEIWCVVHRQPAIRCVEMHYDECTYAQDHKETDNQTHMKGEV